MNITIFLFSLAVTLTLVSYVLIGLKKSIGTLSYFRHTFTCSCNMSKAISYYFDLMSQPSRALWIIMKLSGTTFVEHPVALRRGEHLTEEFKRDVNRFQKVPCINDNGFKLAESIAILRYLSAKGSISSALYPTDAVLRAHVDEILEWHHLGIRMGCGMYFRTVWLEPMLSGEQPAPGKIARVKEIMEQSLYTLENVVLQNGAFIAGDRVTAADIFVASEIEQSRLAGYDAWDKYPKIKAWIDKVRSETNPHYDAGHTFINKMAAKAKL